MFIVGIFILFLLFYVPSSFISPNQIENKLDPDLFPVSCLFNGPCWNDIFLFLFYIL